MERHIKGMVSQLTNSDGLLRWQPQKARTGNSVIYSAVTEIDAGLDTGCFHVCLPVSGTEPYNVDGVTYTAKAGEYFMLNPRQQVRAEAVFDREVKGFCILLTEETLMETAVGLNRSIEKSLDSPFYYPWQQHEFMVKAYHLKENSFGQYLNFVRQKLLHSLEGRVEDLSAFYFEVAVEFLKAHRQIGQHIQGIPSASTLTKQEIYRRLSLAHCYILEKYAEPFSLEDLEEVAFFSKFHIVRLYRQIYGLTPYQHVLKLRMEKAKKMLAKNHSPTEVAMQLSFSDRRAFSKVFKKMVGLAPSDFVRTNKTKN